MKTWADFKDWVLPEVTGAATELVEFYVREAATEFLRKTGILKVEIDPIALTAEVPTYDVDVPSGYGVARLEDLWLGEQPLFPRSTDQLAQMYSNWQTVEGLPLYYFNEDPLTVRLVPVPDRSDYDNVTGWAVLKPLRTATGVEDWIFEDWVDVIAAGAKSMLMAMKQKPWTDPARSAELRVEYYAGCDRAKIKVNQSGTRGPLRVQMRGI